MEIHQLRYFVAVAEEGGRIQNADTLKNWNAERQRLRPRNGSISRNLLSVCKSISWKRNCHLRSATARQGGQRSEVRNRRQRSDRRKFVLARRQNQHARRARYPVVVAFPEVRNRADTGLRFKMSSYSLVERSNDLLTQTV